jgi:hypothetical protein
MPMLRQVPVRAAPTRVARGHEQADAEDLPPPGQRWGEGAHSVLPYLTRTLLAKPASPAETRHPLAAERPPEAVQRPRVPR